MREGNEYKIVLSQFRKLLAKLLLLIFVFNKSSLSKTQGLLLLCHLKITVLKYDKNNMTKITCHEFFSRYQMVSNMILLLDQMRG